MRYRHGTASTMWRTFDGLSLLCIVSHVDRLAGSVREKRHALTCCPPFVTFHPITISPCYIQVTLEDMMANRALTAKAERAARERRMWAFEHYGPPTVQSLEDAMVLPAGVKVTICPPCTTSNGKVVSRAPLRADRFMSVGCDAGGEPRVMAGTSSAPRMQSVISNRAALDEYVPSCTLIKRA